MEVNALRMGASENSVLVMKALKFIDKKHKEGLDKKTVISFLNENVDGADLNMHDGATIFRRLNLKQNKVNGYVDIFNSIYQPDATLMTPEKLHNLEKAALQDNAIKSINKREKEAKSRRMAQYKIS